VRELVVEMERFWNDDRRAVEGCGKLMMAGAGTVVVEILVGGLCLANLE
jgi:hypothetical protein